MENCSAWLSSCTVGQPAVSRRKPVSRRLCVAQSACRLLKSEGVATGGGSAGESAMKAAAKAKALAGGENSGAIAENRRCSAAAAAWRQNGLRGGAWRGAAGGYPMAAARLSQSANQSVW